MVISAVLELVVLSLPSGIYLALCARHGHHREACAVVGLCWPARGGWALALGVFVIATGLGYTASRGIAVIDPAVLHPGSPAAVRWGGGLSWRWARSRTRSRMRSTPWHRPWWSVTMMSS